MTIARIIIAGSLLLIFIWIGALNWIVFWRGFVRKAKAPSWIPLLAGCAGAAALLVVPDPRAHAIAWLPLVIDFGSLPGLLFTAAIHLRTRQ